MKTRNLIFGTLVLAVVSFAAISSTNDSDSVADNSIAQDTIVTGQELFRLNCASCHGVDRKGNPPTFPALVDIKGKLTKVQIKEIVKNGKGLMPPMAHLSEKEIDVITGFLYGEEEQEAMMALLTPVEQGEMLFKSNCAGCHRATTNDPKPQNANTQMCSMMEPAVLAGATKRFTKDEFLNILETGPCYMPSFSYMKEEEKEALYAYLKTLEGKGEPKGKTMGQQCPMIKKGKSCCGM